MESDCQDVMIQINSSEISLVANKATTKWQKEISGEEKCLNTKEELECHVCENICCSTRPAVRQKL